MKKAFLSIVVLAAMVIAPMSVSAVTQESASQNATGHAKIVIPISLTKVKDLEFGTIISTGAAFTVVANPNDSTFTPTGGATLTSELTKSVANFYVAGATGISCLITVPSSALTLTAGSNSVGTVTINSFTTNKTGNTLTISATTANNYFKVGGTLNASAGAHGTFSNTFPVTVSYQ